MSDAMTDGDGGFWMADGDGGWLQMKDADHRIEHRGTEEHYYLRYNNNIVSSVAAASVALMFDGWRAAIDDTSGEWRLAMGDA